MFLEERQSYSFGITKSWASKSPLGFIFCVANHNYLIANHPHSEKARCCSAIQSWTNTLSATCLDIEGNMFVVPKIQRQFSFSVFPAMTLVTDFVRKIKAEVRMDWETSNELKSFSCSVHCCWGPWMISDKETVNIEQIQHFRRNVKDKSPKRKAVLGAVRVLN